jgi:hypothetical protein
MNRLRFLVLVLLGAVAVRAQDEGNRPPAPPPENLTFLTDEYIYVPKYTLSFGVRSLSGSKAAFSGKGQIFSSIDDIGAATGANLTRKYHDGTVLPDARTVLVDSGGGTSSSVPVPPDGQTNTWTYRDAAQVTPDGNIAMHTYTADITDTGAHSKDPRGTTGVEVSVARDMGKITTRFSWNLAAGLSLNDIKSQLRASLPATIVTTTDIYALGGAPAPTAPYGSPSSTTQNVLDANGNQVNNPDGTPQTQTVNTTTLLGTTPLSRSTVTTTAPASVTNTWKLKGAYFTFRFGPTLSLPFTQRFRLTLSAGAAAVYAGTTYTVTQDFQPDTGDPIISKVEDTKGHVLPGYYVDANVEFWLTENTGLYAGAVYQNNGDYKQTVKTDTADYTTKVDLSRLSGLRAGLNIRF